VTLSWPILSNIHIFSSTYCGKTPPGVFESGSVACESDALADRWRTETNHRHGGNYIPAVLALLPHCTCLSARLFGSLHRILPP
jgi:hypothetical protein